MRNKEQIIKEAWEKWGVPYNSKYIDENGFINNKQELPELVDSILIDIRFSGKNHVHFTFTNGMYRPKSLQGIEDNNGWVVLRSEDDLPKEDADCEIRFRDGSTEFTTYRVSVFNFNSSHWKQLTHYKILTKSKPPLW